MRRIRLLSDRIDGAMIIHFEIPATQDHPEILIVFRQHRLAQPVGFAVCDQGEDASAPIFNKTLKLGKALSKADRLSSDMISDPLNDRKIDPPAKGWLGVVFAAGSGLRL